MELEGFDDQRLTVMPVPVPEVFRCTCESLLEVSIVVQCTL